VEGVPSVTTVYRVDAAHPDGPGLDAAAAVLKAGGTAAFPTESFYGLGADALDPAAVARVFRIKGRVEANPVLVLVDSVERALTLVAAAGSEVRALMARHWPGPLTLVLPAGATVPPAITAGTGTVGVRVPGHPVTLALLRVAGMALTGTSANPSGEPPPTGADEVARRLPGLVDVILDGGPTAGGPGSTVADCTVWPPRILRQGPVRL
jgi:L-threonylcarbamoyladenylate synthase